MLRCLCFFIKFLLSVVRKNIEYLRPSLDHETNTIGLVYYLLTSLPGRYSPESCESFFLCFTYSPLCVPGTETRPFASGRRPQNRVQIPSTTSQFAHVLLTKRTHFEDVEFTGNGWNMNWWHMYSPDQYAWGLNVCQWISSADTLFHGAVLEWYWTSENNMQVLHYITGFSIAIQTCIRHT